MDRFIPHKDELGELLQDKCEELFTLMKTIDVKKLGLSEHGVEYFLGSHYKRLFFSIQTSAHLLYNSIKLTQKKVEDVIIMDYGAGIGSLYILAKMIGCKKVIYNDILEEWKQNALLIAQAINIDVDEYVVGDIEATLKVLKSNKITLDIITSRNVVEHIYRLDDFYALIDNYQPNAIIYSSTTANFNNPAMNLFHVFYHLKVEKNYRQQRTDFIKTHFPLLDENTLKQLAFSTRGYEKSGILNAVGVFLKEGKLPKKNYYYTNTCEINYGVWAENILSYQIHKQMAINGNRKCMIKPGFWDTHYQKPWKNKMGAFFNALISLNTTIAFVLAPFIYIIALPQKQTAQ